MKKIKAKKIGLIGSIGCVFLLVLTMIILLHCTIRIPAGYVAVVYNMNGGIEKDTLSQGWKFFPPTKTATLYTIAR